MPSRRIRIVTRLGLSRRRRPNARAQAPCSEFCAGPVRRSFFRPGTNPDPCAIPAPVRSSRRRSKVEMRWFRLDWSTIQIDQTNHHETSAAVSRTRPAPHQGFRASQLYAPRMSIRPWRRKWCPTRGIEPPTHSRGNQAQRVSDALNSFLHCLRLDTGCVRWFNQLLLGAEELQALARRESAQFRNQPVYLFLQATPNCKPCRGPASRTRTTKIVRCPL